MLFALSLTAKAQGSKSVTLFLVGDAGESAVISSPFGNVLRSQIVQAGQDVKVIFLGDNVYPNGMPPASALTRERAEKVLQHQADWVKDTDAHAVFVPGNHDWQQGRKKGQQHLARQQFWIDSRGTKKISFLPRDGCPGPVEVPLTDRALLVIVDSQWFLHKFDKPGLQSSCAARTNEEFLYQLHQIFNKNKDKRILVAAHHPVLTYGDHGGVFSWKEHIFPLRELHPYLYLPLPLIGSLYPVCRRYLVRSRQDIFHPKYRTYAEAMFTIIRKYPGSMYVAGHEHALQYIVKDGVAMIGSGSGAKVSYVRRKKDARFAQDVKGFVKLAIGESGSVDIEFWRVDHRYPAGEKVFTDRLTIHH